MRELIWEGKYATNAAGKRVKAARPRIALPFQTVETSNESSPERQKALDMFSEGRAARLWCENTTY